MQADMPPKPPLAAVSKRYEEAKARLDAELEALRVTNKEADEAADRLRKKSEASRIMKAATPPKGTKT